VRPRVNVKYFASPADQLLYHLPPFIDSSSLAALRCAFNDSQARRPHRVQSHDSFAATAIVSPLLLQQCCANRQIRRDPAIYRVVPSGFRSLMCSSRYSKRDNNRKSGYGFYGTEIREFISIHRYQKYLSIGISERTNDSEGRFEKPWIARRLSNREFIVFRCIRISRSHCNTRWRAFHRTEFRQCSIGSAISGYARIRNVCSLESMRSWFIRPYVARGLLTAAKQTALVKICTVSRMQTRPIERNGTCGLYEAHIIQLEDY